ncbi:hypothetical protein NZ698_02635 [Chryseobacterium sp. PBS4-4]|uniref:DUF4238 domain-containing protein n=1 Tax=Chryseobacterium edaphi TaxID=2976532 RepID=A0ABT2W1G6_9FLAO|nr:hypothetical protein [Chryseobacterium edaphi]MCU7616083.1 hypothetical protein [Chryseobacterium edaphi]
MISNLHNFSFIFGLENKQNQLNFVDINLLKKDNLLFIDPRLIAHNNDKISITMDKYLRKYWSALIHEIKTGTISNTFKLMRGLAEPKETHLGFSEKKQSGNSMGDKLKPKFIKELITLINTKNGHLTNLEDIEFFIDKVGEDRISDITTKIVKQVLIDFTISECKKYNIETKSVMQKDIWNYETGEWEKKSVELPIFDNKPVILIPKNIVRLKGGSKNIVSCFYRFAIREYVLNDNSILQKIPPTGKDGKHLIKDVKNQFPNSKEILNSWNNQFPKLMVDFKSDYLHEKIICLTDEQIEMIVYDINYQNVG